VSRAIPLSNKILLGLEYLQQITYPSPQYQNIDVLVMEVLQHITNPMPITYKFLVITKTHLSLSPK